MRIATVTRKGQVTLPKQIRDQLGIHGGDRIVFRADRNGRVWVEPATQDLLKLRGIFGPTDRVRSQEELDEAVRRGASGRRR